MILVCLASLRQAHLQRYQKDASVYGVASNGFMWTFVTITDEGVVKMSRNFGGWLACLKCTYFWR